MKTLEVIYQFASAILAIVTFFPGIVGDALAKSDASADAEVSAYSESESGRFNMPVTRMRPQFVGGRGRGGFPRGGRGRGARGWGGRGRGGPGRGGRGRGGIGRGGHGQQDHEQNQGQNAQESKRQKDPSKSTKKEVTDYRDNGEIIASDMDASKSKTKDEDSTSKSEADESTSKSKDESAKSKKKDSKNKSKTDKSTSEETLDDSDEPDESGESEKPKSKLQKASSAISQASEMTASIGSGESSIRKMLMMNMMDNNKPNAHTDYANANPEYTNNNQAKTAVEVEDEYANEDENEIEYEKSTAKNTKLVIEAEEYMDEIEPAVKSTSKAKSTAEIKSTTEARSAANVTSTTKPIPAPEKEEAS